MLHRIWLSFFVIGFASALYQWLILGSGDVFQKMVKASFDMASLSVELSIGLIGVLSLWLGIAALGEASGLIGKLANALSPLFVRLMPEVPERNLGLELARVTESAASAGGATSGITSTGASSNQGACEAACTRRSSASRSRPAGLIATR